MNFDLVMTNSYASALRGVTMVEILTILSITSILIGLGAPQFLSSTNAGKYWKQPAA